MVAVTGQLTDRVISCRLLEVGVTARLVERVVSGHLVVSGLQIMSPW